MLKENDLDFYIAARGEEAEKEAFKLASTLRSRNVKTEINHMGRSIKAEMKYANKMGALFTTIIGEDELNGSPLRIKRMSDGEIFEVSLHDIDKIVETLK